MPSADLPSRDPCTSMPFNSLSPAQDQAQPFTRGECPHPGRCRIGLLAGCKVYLVCISHFHLQFTHSGVTAIQRTHKHTVRSHTTTQSLAGELPPSSPPSEPRSPHPLRYAHTQPAPALTPGFGDAGIRRIHGIH